VPCLRLSTGLSSNPISGLRKPRAAIDSRGLGLCARCWMRVAKTLLLEAWVHKPGILRLPARSDIPSGI
jgi:hypothetical protein